MFKLSRNDFLSETCYIGRDSFRFISRKNDHGGVLLHNYDSGYNAQRVGRGVKGLIGNTRETA